VLDEFLTTFHV